jgi:hypothetical protein
MTSDEPSDQEECSRPRRTQIFLLLFLVFQLVVPLTYYLRDNPYDERFAWRMFSAVRMYQCNVEMREGSEDRMRPVPLGRVIHQAWINHLRRNRQSVALRLLERRCEEQQVNRVTIQTTCLNADGAPLPATHYTRDCTSEISQVTSGTL